MNVRQRHYDLLAWPAVLLTAAWLVATAAEAQQQNERSASQVQTTKNVARGFSVRREGERWSLVTPQGKPFFSLGVCCLFQGPAHNDYDPENPSYARWRYYDSPESWADNSLRRLKIWGFTTVGGWSDYQDLRRSLEMPIGFTPVLHLGSTAGAPWWDMWDEQNVARMEDVARKQIVALRDDPRLIGYYSDNELGWWNATLFKMTLEQAPTSGQRQRLIQLLRNTYRDDWEKLLADFEPAQAENWDELARNGRLYLRPGGNGMRVMRRFLALLAGRYYQLAHDIIRKHDSHALILGDRYQSFYYPEVARAAAPHVDIVSTNLNAHWNDGTFLRCYLDTLHKLTGKPILVSEIYMAAAENNSGNRNTSGVFPVVASQRERAVSTRNTLAALTRLPYVVGIDWFQYADEPTHGREDGENFNFGLVDIHNQPYAELVEMFKQFDPELAMNSALRAPHSALDGVPAAPEDPFAHFEANLALKHWDRQRGFVPPTSELPVADLYVCWSPQALYFGLYGWDAIDEHFYSSGHVPKIDRAVWTVGPDLPITSGGKGARKEKNRDALASNSALRIPNSKLVRVTLGAGREPLINDPTIRVESLSGTKHTVRLISILELPASRFGKEEFTVGDTVGFASTFTTHARASRVDWMGSFKLSK